MSSKIKVGLLAIVAALMFALPGAFMTGGVTPALAAEDGDVCGVWSSTGSKANVGEHFYVLARIRDNFKWTFVLDVEDDDDENDGDDEDAVANYATLDLYDVSILVPFLSVSIDGHTGEAKIVDRIEDDTPAVPMWWVGESAPYHYGEAEDNTISPTNQILSLQVLTEFASEAGDDDFPGDTDSLDIWEYFIERSATPEDKAANVAGALANCGSQFLSGRGVTDANRIEVSVSLQLCWLTGNDDDNVWCEALDDLLGIDDDDDDLRLSLELDGWSEISVKCWKPGQIKISFDPTGWGVIDIDDLTVEGDLPRSPGDFTSAQWDALIANYEGRSIDIDCIGTSHHATVAVSPASVEIKPVGTNVSVSVATVTVYDSNGKRLDGAEVNFSVNNCSVSASATGPFSAKEVVTTTDTDTAGDLTFQSQHAAEGDELFAGTAEAYIQCNVSGAAPGSVVVTYIIDKIAINTPSGAGLSGTATVTVVGPPAGLKIEASPATSTCGNPVVATATVTDATGKPVSDGTQVYFTTVSATGSQGGAEGAQGAVTTTNGVAAITLSLNPQDNGTHTVSARTGGNDLTGAPVNVVTSNTTVSCTLAASAAPTISAPRTGTGPDTTVSGIRPPNTGDAGLATGNSSSTLFAAIAGVFALTGLAIVKFARR